MLIDWFTVAAQVVNFLILALLLRKFLYRPVTNAIAQRKQKIADELAESEAIRQDALRTKAVYEEKYTEFENERAQLLTKTLKEVEEEKSRRLEEVRKELEEERTRLIKAFHDQEKAIHTQISQRAHEEVFSLARKVLSGLASKDLETFIADEFIRHLQDPELVGQQKLRQTLHAGERNVITVRSAFPMDSGRQEMVTEALSRILDPDKVTPGFEIKPELICGIEIQVNHYKLEWHVAGDLEEIQTGEVS